MYHRKLFIIFFIPFLIAGMSFAQEGKKIGVGIALIDMQKVFEANMSGFVLDPVAAFFDGRVCRIGFH